MLRRLTKSAWGSLAAAVALTLSITACQHMERPSVPAMTRSAHLQEAEGMPHVEREFRAAWVATVANIDWPSRPGLPTEEQQQEALAILETSSRLNLNALVLQIRPHCDALYESNLEPWSYYLTGVQGQAPDPYYDPLQFWVEESHARGIELHVWFNPYRAHHTSTRGDIHPSHIVQARPDLAYPLANGMWWLDPAKKEVQDHSMAVIMDVVRRYNIDGVHMDDYFYPYPSYNDGADFPDDETWAEYQAAGGKLSRGDWRREAVDKFVERMYKEVKAEKPWVKVGLSPFGIWRPHHPPSIRGFDQYDQLYADAKLWLNKGWVDYYTPQLYWPTTQIPQSFPVLLAWWNEQNTKNRNIWPGLGTYRITAQDDGSTTVAEIFTQVMITRALNPEGPGQVHFSFKHLLNNVAGIADTLANGPYRTPALVPASPWLDARPPAAPGVSAAADGDLLHVRWTASGSEPAFVWVVAVEKSGAWSYEIVPAATRHHAIQVKGTITRTVSRNQGTEVEEVEEEAQPASRVAVAAVDRLGNKSGWTILNVASE